MEFVSRDTVGWFYLPLCDLIISIFLHSHKYLVNGKGRAIKSYGHRVPPMQIEKDIVALLEENEKQKMQVPRLQ